MEFEHGARVNFRIDAAVGVRDTGKICGGPLYLVGVALRA